MTYPFKFWFCLSRYFLPNKDFGLDFYPGSSASHYDFWLRRNRGVFFFVHLKILATDLPRGALSGEIKTGSGAAEERDQGQGDGSHNGKGRGERKGFGPVSHGRRENPGPE